jgi:ribosomal protein L7/L12
VHGLYNCDPHPGNYLFMPDGRLCVLDYGCTRQFAPDFVERLAAITAAARTDSPRDLEAALHALDVVPFSGAYDHESARRLVRGFYGPMLRDEEIRFEHDDATRMREMLSNRRALLRLNLPGEFLFLLRIRFGLASVLAELRAKANWSHFESELIAAGVALRQSGEGAWTSPPTLSAALRRPKERFDVVLRAPGAEVIAVLRELREVTGLSLTQLKSVVDSCPRTLKEGMVREAADGVADRLRGLGAEVEVVTTAGGDGARRAEV